MIDVKKLVEGFNMGECSIMMRTCREDMTSYRRFKWPTEGPVECPDWLPNETCENGLFGLLWGEGEPGTWYYEVYMLCVVRNANIVYVGSKIKVPRAWVIAVGSRAEITEALYRYRPGKIYTMTVINGENKQLGGDLSIQVARGGRKKFQEGGNYSYQYSLLMNSVQKAEYGSIQRGGSYTTQTAGVCSVMIGGSGARQRGGKGTIMIADVGNYYIPEAIAVVGYNGIKPNVFYTFNVCTNKWEESKVQTVPLVQDSVWAPVQNSVL